MGKLFVLIGKSGSGKSSIEKEIDRLGYANKIISTTTRKPRPYERDTIDYYFINETVFDVYLKQGQYAEHSKYPTVWGMASYGINKNDIKLNEGNAIAVVNPDGYSQLIESLGKENVVGIYIDRDDRERVISAIERDKSDNLVSILEEVTRRVKADEIDFSGMKDKADYVVKNHRLHIAIDEVINIIKKESV